MTKPVTLSEEAFRELRKAKRSNESTSDTVLRLIREARSAQKDPYKMLRVRLERVMSPAEHRRAVAESRRADRDPWEA